MSNQRICCSAAKTFDGCSSYVCKALRMAEADPKTYLLSIASYADGTTSLVIDWFDGASLVTATSSLNVLGSDLTNARIINMPSLSDSGKISLTIDTPIVLPLFGQYSINATFSFADGYLVPDDALSSPPCICRKLIYHCKGYYRLLGCSWWKSNYSSSRKSSIRHSFGSRRVHGIPRNRRSSIH